MNDENEVSLKEFMLKQLDDIRNENDRRFIGIEKNIDTAFVAAQAAIKQSAETAKESVTKSEIGVEKRSDAVYVTLSKLQDSLAAVMPRAEAEQRFSALSDKIDELKTSRDETAGKSTGMDKTWAVLLGFLGAVATVVAIVSQL